VLIDFENVELPLLYLGVSAAQRKTKVENALEKMQVMHRRNECVKWASEEILSSYRILHKATLTFCELHA
jgi:ABC-type ATPase involved in cell division